MSASANELPKTHSASVFSLASGRALRDRICACLGVVPGGHEERDFEDGEHKLRPLQSVRGRDVYVVESLYGDDALSVDDKIVRVLFFVGALADAGARRVTAVFPYLSYARKDRRTKPRDPVSMRYLAMLIEAVGVDRVVAIDVHNPAAFENAFRIPTEHLGAVTAFVDAFARIVGDQAVAVVSPDAGGVKRAERFRQALERRLAREVSFAFVEKFRSEGVVRGGTLAGDVKGRVAIVIDDLISSGTTIARAAAACREHGARAVHAAASHGVFAAGASGILAAAEIERLVILDTIPVHRLGVEFARERLQVIDCAPLLAAAIHGLHTEGQDLDLIES